MNNSIICKLNISEKEFDDLANDTDGFSGSDISYFVSVSFTLDIGMSPK